MRNLEAAPPAGSLPRPMVWSKRVSTICGFGLAAVWLWAGLSKAADPSMGVLAVRAYEIVPEMFVRPVACGLPFVEIGIAALLALGIGTSIAANRFRERADARGCIRRARGHSGGAEALGYA